jgi:peptide/nickel transport system permease protein
MDKAIMPACCSFGTFGSSDGVMALLRIIAVKFLQAVPVILIISILAFLLLSLLPGDPAIIIAGEQASPEAVERVRVQLGLDRSFLQQLAIWLLNLARGNFGSSLILNQSVISAVAERLPVTLSLTALSISVTIPMASCWGRLRLISGAAGSIRL